MIPVVCVRTRVYVEVMGRDTSSFMGIGCRAKVEIGFREVPISGTALVINCRVTRHFTHFLPLDFAQGKHVSPVMKALKVDCGVYGNHDFDFGPDELIKLARECEMPWVMTNVDDTREPGVGSGPERGL